MSDEKECFFIAPIGDEGSEVRERSNKVKEFIVEEAVSEFGYSVTRADELEEPGSITNQIIDKTVESELVVADLTDHNPNVFYELAVRHATGEPYISLITSGESIPFDISDFRAIYYGLDVADAARARDEIKGHLLSIKEGDSISENPISQSAELKSLRESGDPTDKGLAEMLESVGRLTTKVDRLEQSIEHIKENTGIDERNSTEARTPEDSENIKISRGFGDEDYEGILEKVKLIKKSNGRDSEHDGKLVKAQYDG
ncbi:hypothetical protein [Halomarina rubra]|uniref:Nucleoside 2-deoxyribosyltransferase n=1 Tax=Halomarina rubra TaxID=2071873 RepID=A0ABD6ASH8_9EURY|nr:hypothetical protein [Halomarina rubra]